MDRMDGMDGKWDRWDGWDGTRHWDRLTIWDERANRTDGSNGTGVKDGIDGDES